MAHDENLTASSSKVIEKTQLLDLDALATKRGYDREDIAMMLEIFLNKVDAQLETIAVAVNEKDYETIFATSHGLRGSLLNIGFDETSEVVKEMELAAKASQDINYEEKFLQLKEMIEIIKRSTYE